MDINAYLERIGYRGSRFPTAETLKALNRAHLLTVPFENLDLHLGRSIFLDETALFDKIVNHRRGGFCYELNGLFSALLRDLGFRVTLINSLIPEKHHGCGLSHDHPILLVELKERWIVDVGFGDAYRRPLRLDDSGEQTGAGAAYRVQPSGNGRWNFYERMENGEWDFFYTFTLQPCRMIDFLEACRYYETSPNSDFKQRRLCVRATPDGHITLTDDHLILQRNGRRKEIPLASEQDFIQALSEHFRIEVD